MRLAFAYAIAGLLIAGAFFTSPSLALDESQGTPVILKPKDGAVITGPVTMIVGFKMGQMGEMQGEEQHYGAHLHLIVDSPLPKEGTTVPMDEKHIHLMNSEQTTVLNLAPGKHTLQLIVGGDDHVIRAHAPHSELVTITIQ
jgi:hypothetical protein